MSPPPLAIHSRLHAFTAAVAASGIKRPPRDPGAHILYTDPFESSSHAKFYPRTHRFEAEGLSMAHFERLISIFNAAQGGIEITDLRLKNCKLQGSLFFCLVSKHLHSLVLSHVQIFECDLITAPGVNPTPRSPAWWEDVLPVFIHQARLRHCYLEGLTDYRTTLSTEGAAVPGFRAETSKEIRKELKALFWELRWSSWCLETAEQSLAEIHDELRML